MKTVLLTSLLAASSLVSIGTAAAQPAIVAKAAVGDALSSAEREETLAFVELKQARTQMAAARARWDAAVADENPVDAGTWAARHYDAMQLRNRALARWQHAADRLDALRASR